MQLLLLHQLPHATQTLVCFARRPFVYVTTKKKAGLSKAVAHQPEVLAI